MKSSGTTRRQTTINYNRVGLSFVTPPPEKTFVKRGYGERVGRSSLATPHPTTAVHNANRCLCSPRMPGILRMTHQQRRTIISALFGLTFFASVLTVSASNVLPCPVRPDRNYHADSGPKARGGGSLAVVEKRPRRWIQERTVAEH